MKCDGIVAMLPSGSEYVFTCIALVHKYMMWDWGLIFKVHFTQYSLPIFQRSKVENYDPNSITGHVGTK